MGSADLRLRIRAAREGFLATGATHESAVDDVVAASWQRSRSAGVDAAASQAPFYSDLDISSRLVRCSRPVIDRLSEETAEIPLSIALTDGKARVLTRVDNARSIGLLLDNVWFAPGFDYAEGGMGTNGVGTVFESGQPIQIVGPEHFHERLQPFACSGSPIRDPLSGRIEGVLDISCVDRAFESTDALAGPVCGPRHRAQPADRPQPVPAGLVRDIHPHRSTLSRCSRGYRRRSCHGQRRRPGTSHTGGAGDHPGSRALPG